MLIISAFLISYSSLLAPFAIPSWTVVFGSSTLAILLTGLKAGWRQPRLRGRVLFILALMALLAAGFTQVLAANDLPSGLPAYQALPGRTGIYLFLGGLAAFLLTWLALGESEGSASGAALAAAGLYGSVIFFRVSAVPEVGYAFSVLAGFGVLAYIAMNNVPIRLAPGEKTFWKWAVAFTLAQLAAAAISPVPHQSLIYVTYGLVLLSLAALVSIQLRSQRALRIAAWLVVLLGAGIPVLFALIKTIGIGIDFGSSAAITYRLHPSEMGGANLLARSLLISAPLGMALWITGPADRRSSRRRKSGLIFLQAASLAVILYARSFEGFFAWLVALLIFGILAGWPRIQTAWSRISQRKIHRIALFFIAGLLIVSAIYVGFRAGFAMNPYSFNGRFGHWIGALTAFKNNPVLGGGPDNEYLYTQYTGAVSLFGDVPVIIDDPLYLIRYRWGMLKVHAHSLVLETAAFSGLAGVISGGGMLIALIRLGFQAWRRADGRLKVIAAACLAGILGELAWGVLDVIRESPPFFTFPIWAVVGMTLAAGRLTNPGEPEPRENSHSNLHRYRSLGMLGLAILMVLIPSLAGNRYGSGFLAFQEHRWEEAAQNYQSVTRVNPIAHQAYWMLSKAELELGRLDSAAQHLAKAISLKRGYSPYLSQAGWLAWLTGDLEAAERYFTEAIAADPLESWTAGLHANLGLLKVHQGQETEAIGYLARSLEYHPELAVEADWAKLQTPDGSIRVILSPAYRQAVSVDLQKRIQAHLGMANITSQHFEQPLEVSGSISLDQVLETLHKRYQAQVSLSDPDAHLILAAEAEAARQAGLDEHAQEAYREYQSLRPHSAFGYRDLGILFAEQSRLADAEVWLKKAVEVSPKNIDALRLLTTVQVDLQKPGEAGATFSRLMPIASASSNSFQLQYFDVDLMMAMRQFAHASNNANLELQAQDWLAKIQATPDSYLTLANIAQSQGNQALAIASCWRAYQASVKNWVRPYDGRLWSAAVCIAQSDMTAEQISARLKRTSSHFTNQLFLGHVARLRGAMELGEEYYREAAEARPGESSPYYYLGELYNSQGRVAEAEQAYLRAEELDGREALASLALGELYESTGKLKEALAAYHTAVGRAPGWDEAQLALGNFYLKTEDSGQADARFKIARQLSGNFDPAKRYDLASSLASASLTANVSDGYIKNGIYEIDGVRKFSIFMHPISVASYTLRLPDTAAESSPRLEFSLGMLPESWSQAGDGVNFSIDIQTFGQTIGIFSAYIDPKHNPQHRQWREEQVDLSQYAGQEVTLTLRTDGGEIGDLQYDWACWGEPVIAVR